MLIDDRSAMPTNVLLRKACWSASSARWFGFASFTNLWGSLLSVGYKAELRCGSNEDRFASNREMTRNARIYWVIKWNEREMCYRNYERVIPFSMQATLEEAHPAPGIFSRRRCITDLCWQVNVSVCNGKAERCNRHLNCPSWSREAYLTRNSRTRWRKLPTTSWTPNFSFEERQGVIEPQMFESNVWRVPTLKVNVETS